MYRIRLIAALGAALATFLVPAVVSTTAPARAAGSRDHAGWQDRLNDIVGAGAIGVVAEVRDEHGAWRGSGGFAELGKTRPVPTPARIRIGSITKTFVAAVTLQLVAEGRVRLDDSVETWLPGAVPDGERITIRHLLAHTSGLPDYLRTFPMHSPTALLHALRRTWSPWELVERSNGQPSPLEPGENAEYSNTNYIVLGLVIQEVTDRPYGVEVEQRIIRPLRLNHTSLPGTFPRVRGPHLHGYLPVEENGEVRALDVTRRNPSAMWAAGEMISTPADLNRFYAALLDGRLLPEHLLAEMKEPVDGWDFGLGLRQRKPDGCDVTAYGHDGDALGFETWTFVTNDSSRQVTISITPWGGADLEDAVLAMVDEVLCP